MVTYGGRKSRAGMQCRLLWVYSIVFPFSFIKLNTKLKHSLGPLCFLHRLHSHHPQPLACSWKPQRGRGHDVLGKDWLCHWLCGGQYQDICLAWQASHPQVTGGASLVEPTRLLAAGGWFLFEPDRSCTASLPSCLWEMEVVSKGCGSAVISEVRLFPALREQRQEV